MSEVPLYKSVNFHVKWGGVLHISSPSSTWRQAVVLIDPTFPAQSTPSPLVDVAV